MPRAGLLVHELDATHVYFGNRAAGAIERAPLAGGAPEAVESVESPYVPAYVALDSGYVYWGERLTSGGGRDSLSPVGTGEREALASPLRRRPVKRAVGIDRWLETDMI